MTNVFRRCLCLVALLPALAWAETTPPKGAFDSRVRVVDYNPADVVRINTFYGVSTHIQFGANESIKDVAVGDQDAWSVVDRGSHLFIKPKAQKADTNVTVVTDKRVYQFALMVQPHNMRDATAWRNPNLVFSLSFRYPEDEAAKLVALAKQAETAATRSDVQNRLADAKRRDENHDYWVAGSEEISPTAARDDGRFIYLAFSHNRDMPTIYAVDAEGNESLVNINVEGNEIVVQRLVRKLTLRRGISVACVVNKSFDLNGGKDNSSGTVAPDVERVIKGAR